MKQLDTLIIRERYCGPTESGNGGYVCGLLASYLGNGAIVRLMAPPPLESTLDIWSSDPMTVVMKSGEQEIASARLAPFDLVVPKPVSLDAARKAAEGFTGHRYHPFPYCFVCGPARDEHDGLRIFPGKVDGTDLVAAPWMPDNILGDNDGKVRAEYLWAALDCTGAFALEFGPDKVLVLGQFQVEVKRLPSVGEPCVVTGWKIGEEGRKQYAGTAVFTSEGELCGASKATWIQLRGQ